MKKTTTLILVALVAILFAFQWGININQETFRPMNSGGAGPGKQVLLGNQTVLLVTLDLS